uniref:Uncharacterized protein n=1 Tax=Arundo donax TaxID=35708 RepID=A0A0A9E637_ARUDO
MSGAKARPASHSSTGIRTMYTILQLQTLLEERIDAVCMTYMG